MRRTFAAWSSMVLIAAVAAGLLSHARAQSVPQPPVETPPAQAQPTFSTRSDLIVVHALVENNRGAAVSGLNQSDFLVYEDNRPQEIAFFSTADAPASIGLLIDNSTSMMNKRDGVVASVVGFTDLSNSEDEVFVLAFNEDVVEAWAPSVIASGHRDVLRRTLMRAISARGQTALYDAVAVGLNRLAAAKHTRQVMVIVSDGSDNASRTTSQEQMLAGAQASSAMIYTVILDDPVDRGGNPRLMKRIAETTGGESFSPKRIDDVPEALAHIARDIRATYTIGYAPSNQLRDGTMRKLRVSAKGPDGRTLKVQTRGGYVAPKGESHEERNRAR